jgi:hypothetical protein
MVRNRVPATLAGLWNTIIIRPPFGPSFEYWSITRSDVLPSLAVITMREREETVSD